MKTIKIGYDPFLIRDIKKIVYEQNEIPKVQLFNSKDVVSGNPTSNVAVAFVYTWKSDLPPEEIRQFFLKISNYCALTGFWRTTNGAKYVFANLLSNPNINKIILLVFDKKDNGHMLVDALEKFWKNGTNSNGIILNTKAANPKFEGVPIEALERIRKQCDLIIGRDLSFGDFDRIEHLVRGCIQEPQNAIETPEGFEFITNTLCKASCKKIYDGGCRFDEPMLLELAQAAENIIFEERALATTIGQSVQAETLTDALTQAAAFIYKNGTMLRDQRGIMIIECRSISITILEPLKSIPDGFSEEYLKKYTDEFLNGGENILDDFVYTYHNRIFKRWGNQVEKVVKLLISKPNTRRATISLWDSQDDIERENSPCLDILWFVVRENKLEMHALYRSHHIATVTHDGRLIKGEGAFVPNIYALASLQKIVAQRIGVSNGPIVITDFSGHLYVSNIQQTI
ncbi:MAG: thymidylate synthase [Candidatus Woesearchaeota archaeon]